MPRSTHPPTRRRSSLAIAESAAGAATRDRIEDFTRGADKIDLTPILGSSLHIVSAYDGHAGAVTETVSGAWVTLNVDVDGNKKGDMQIQVHTGGGALAIGDFVLM